MINENQAAISASQSLTPESLGQFRQRELSVRVRQVLLADSLLLSAPVMAQSSTLELSSLDGSTGFVINGVAAGELIPKNMSIAVIASVAFLQKFYL